MANSYSQSGEPTEKLPPQSIESEQALLGALMLEKEAFWRVADFIEPADFYKRAHQHIYEAMQTLGRRGDPIDVRTVATRLQESEQLDGVGGSGYLTELVNSVPTASNALAYAKTIQKKRILRDLINASYEIGRLGYDEESEVEQILDSAEERIFTIAQKGVTQQFTPIKQLLSEAYERIAHQSDHPDELTGVATGFAPLDNVLAGLQPTDLSILAARPSFGKSSLGLNIAQNVATSLGKPVGIFSLEMSREQVAERMLSAQSRLDLWKIRMGRLSEKNNPSDYDIINHALDQLAEAPVFIDDTSSPTVLQIKAMARRLQAERGLGLVIVDYLQLMQPPNPADSIVQQVSQISRGLKELAKELRVPVLALSQLSRAVEQRQPPVPRLSDLRESGSLEQDSDVVMFINRPDKYKESAEPNIAELIIAKHRNGPTGKVNLHFNESIVAFEALAREDEEAGEGGEEEVLGGVDF